MRKISLAFICLIALFSVISLLTGCTTTSTGPAFEAQTVPEGKALVYVYRYGTGKGALKTYVIEVNGYKIASLSNNSYIPYTARHGLTEFSSRAEYTSSVRANIKAGQTYYLRLSVEKGALVGRPKLKFVSEEIGKSEIAGCKIIGGN